MLCHHDLIPLKHAKIVLRFSSSNDPLATSFGEKRSKCDKF